MQYAWKHDYETGNETIDSQHKLIFEAANALHEAVMRCKEDEILDQSFSLLLQYTNTHFSDEEEYYRQIGSSLLTTQQVEHRDMLNELREIWHDKRIGSRDAGTDLDIWMERRLIPHIIAEDTRAQKARA